MRTRLFLTLLTVVMLTAGSGWAQSGEMTLDHTDGLYDATSINIDDSIRFYVRMNNTSSGDITGYTNGFRVYSDDGAVWSPMGTLLGVYTGAITTGMIGNQFINVFSSDGMEADTVGFGGFKIFEPGIAPGFNEVVWTIEIGTFDASNHCKTICLDSSFVPPASTWKWSTTAGDQFPTWDGPHCFTIFDPSQGPCGGTNTPPVLDPIGNKTTDENANLNFIVTASDTDGDPLVMSLGSHNIPLGYSYTDNGDGSGTFDWTPLFDDAGVYSATFEVSDGTETVSETIQITVNESYRIPILVVGPERTIGECAALSFDISATDPEGGTITFGMASNPTAGTLTDHGNGTATFEWTPVSGDAAGSPYNVDFTATSSVSSMTDAEIVTINVTPNLSPVFTPSVSDQAVGEGDLVSFTITVDDPEDGSIPASMISAPLSATFDAPSGAFSWLTATGDEAVSPYMVIFSTDDGCNAPVEDTVMINVTAPNAAPVFDPIADQILNETQTLSVAVNVTDSDGEPITISVAFTDLPGAAIFTDNGDGTGSLDWVTTYNDAGVYAVDLMATDGIAEVHETFAVTVNNVNRLPVLADPGNQIVDEGVNLTFGLTATDPDGDALVLTMDTDALGALLTDNGDGTATFDWTPTFADAGMYTATFWANDGTDSVSQMITITVDDINQSPILDPIENKVVAESANLNFGVSANDPDGDPVTLTMMSGDLPMAATFTDNGNGTGTFDWTTTPADGDIYSATFTASDGLGGEASETISIEVTDINFPPVIDPISDFFITECDEIYATFSAFNADGDPITLTMDGLVENMTFTDNGDGTGLFIFLPSFTQAGSYILTLTASDGIDQDMETFEIFVDDCQPGSEGDTLFIVNQPAVPGAIVTVPVNMTNTDCDLIGFHVVFGWNSEFIRLDNVDFTGSLLGAFTDLTMSIDNLAHTVTIDAVQVPGDGVVPAGSSGLMSNLEFSIDALAPDGAYEISPFLVTLPGLNPIFVRDCGSGAEEVQPFVHENGGSILIAQSPTAVCGTVVDESWNEIVGATVELWDDLPAGMVEMTATTNSFGSFTFDAINSIPFDLYAHASGYYPNSLLNVNFGETGLIIQLMPHQAVTPTQEMVFFYCGGEGALTTYMGGPVPVGSIIDAYDDEGTRCGTQVVTTAGKYLAMPVYRDDPTTQADEGADPGDVIRFYINNIEAIPFGDHIWTQDKDQFLVCLEVSDQVTQNCLLAEEWNLVSWHIDTPTDAIENVLSSLGSCVDFVIGFEQGGLAYDPDLVEFSTLHNVDHLSGYWIKVRQGCGSVSLDVTGIGVPVSTPIPVTAGWNLVSYLPETSIPTPDALASIHSDLVVAIGYDGGATIYEPGMPGNTLTDMNSCLGYWVKVLQGGNLVYPGGAPLPSSQIKGVTLPMAASDAGKPDVVQSTRWVNIYSHNLTLNGEKLGAGTIITAHTEDGAKVGHFTIGSKGTFGFMSVYGDDPMTETTDGVAFGETFYLAVNDQPTDQRFSWPGNGERMEISGLTAKVEPEVLPTSYSLKQNYPNPFNPETTIGFSLAKAGKARVDVYNILGELVATPFDGAANAGQNQVIWDGTNRDGNSVSSGIYFYRLTADNFSETKKMTLLK